MKVHILPCGLQSLKEQLCKCLARRFFRIEPSTLAAALKGLGTQMAVQLLQRHSLCCPLECFLVEVGSAMIVRAVAALVGFLPTAHPRCVGLRALIWQLNFPASRVRVLRSLLVGLTRVLHTGTW